MFTGIVEKVGKVLECNHFRLRVEADFSDLVVGESVAINGVCLTTVSAEELIFDMSEETLAKTSLGALVEGSAVNVERAMRANDRLGGHIVQGHVDTTTTLLAIEPQEGSSVYRFAVPGDGRYMIEKGSICLDGISLTIVGLSETSFEVWVIPHTLANTNLGTKAVGDRLNVEFDMIAKYVERLVAPVKG